MQTLLAHQSLVRGNLPPRHIYSAIVQNQTAEKIHCYVEYRTLTGTDNDVIEFDVDGNGGKFKCEEKIHISCSSSPISSNMYPKMIHSLEVKRSDGSTVKWVAPFDNVPENNTHQWRFIVEQDGIQSQPD